ncbi:MAG: SPFH domain-containing protein [Acidimicrobiales bacterium]|nr:SPFH domain-containing protein [Acidimicrobiales bacterium]
MSNVIRGKVPNPLADMRMSGAKRVVVSIVAGIVGLVVLSTIFGAWKSTPVDQIGLHYSGGPIEGTKFQKVVEPGSGRRFLGLADTLVLLPVTQRDYTANSDEGADGAPIVAPAKGGVEMLFEVAAYFTLNTGDKTVRQFYERVCVKFQCDSESGWDQMLRINFRGPIEQAIQQEIRAFTVDQLYAGVTNTSAPLVGEDTAVAILEQVQNNIAADLKENINTVLGGAYFCGPTFSRANADKCPDFQFQITSAYPTSEAVRAAYAKNSASAQAVIDAQNKAKAAVEEANGQRQAQAALAGLYSDRNYLDYLRALALQECARNEKCTIVVSDGSDVNVNTGP